MGIINLGPDSVNTTGLEVVTITTGTALPVGGMYFSTPVNYIASVSSSSLLRYTKPIPEAGTNNYYSFFLNVPGLLVWGDNNPSTDAEFLVNWNLMQPFFFPDFPVSDFNFFLQNQIVPPTGGGLGVVTNGMNLRPSTISSQSAEILPASNAISAFDFDPLGPPIVCGGTFTVKIIPV